MLLQRLRKGTTNSGMGDTVRIVSFRACCRTAGEEVLRGRKPSGQQIRFRHGLKRMPDVRLIAEAVELGPALLEQSSRDIEVSQPHVHVGDAEQRAAPQSGIVAAPALLQYAGERIEGSGEIPLRGERSPEPVERARFATSIGARAIQLTGAAVIGNGAAEVSLDKLDVAGVDKRRGERSCVVQPLLDRQRFAKCGERVGVFELRILRRAETNERERDTLVIAQFPFDRDKLLVDRSSGGEVALIVKRIAYVLQRIGLQLLVADSYREVERALEQRLRSRIGSSLRRRRGLARHGGHQ